ncbi:hypothetical protein [Pseudonocardia phyllosphaerae]|uniref:hypothetical protein n=1 Tax=Pseudonocardia phyllosphaerae TaxID=3390502 RepID=UPI0039791695
MGVVESLPDGVVEGWSRRVSSVGEAHGGAAGVGCAEHRVEVGQGGDGSAALFVVLGGSDGMQRSHLLRGGITARMYPIGY